MAGKETTRYGVDRPLIDLKAIDLAAAIENATRDVASVLADPTDPLREFLDPKMAVTNPVECIRQARAALAIKQADERAALYKQAEADAEKARQAELAQKNLDNYVGALRMLPEHEARKLVPGEWKDRNSDEFMSAVYAKIAADAAAAHAAKADADAAAANLAATGGAPTAPAASTPAAPVKPATKQAAGNRGGNRAQGSTTGTGTAGTDTDKGTEGDTPADAEKTGGTTDAPAEKDAAEPAAKEEAAKTETPAP